MEEHQSKKKKIEKGLEISNDELSHILSFLDFGSILNLCCVNKEMYQNIEKIAKNKTPEVIQDPWTIGKAFSKQIITIKSKEDLLLFQKKKLAIEGLVLEGVYTPDGKHSKSILYLRDPKEKQNLKDRTILVDQDIFIDKSQLQKLKKLKMIHFHSTGSFEAQDYEIIFQIPNLEEVIFSELSMSNFDQVSFDFQDKTITSVKRLTYSDNGETMQTLVKLLNLFPNLEHVKFVTEGIMENETFLELLKLENLKSIWIESYDGGHPAIANNITDEVFAQVVNGLKNLEEITLKHCHSINGSFFSYIKNPRLRKIDVARNVKPI